MGKQRHRGCALITTQSPLPQPPTLQNPQDPRGSRSDWESGVPLLLLLPPTSTVHTAAGTVLVSYCRLMGWCHSSTHLPRGSHQAGITATRFLLSLPQAPWRVSPAPAHSSPATWAFLLFLKQSKCISHSETTYLPFFLPGMLFS